MMRAIPQTAIAALLAACLLAACGHTPTQAELIAVDAMIQHTDSMSAEMDRADTDALRHMEALFEAERPALDKRFADTLNPREAEVLGNYHRAMAERLPGLLAQLAGERVELDSAGHRLRDLRHDMQQGLMGRAQRTSALDAEKRWNTTLRQQLDSINARTHALVRDRKAWRAAIDSLLRP